MPQEIKDGINDRISKTLKQKYADGMKIPNAKIGIREDLGMSFRSTWEANYARILKYTGQDINYEAERFVLYNEENNEIEYVYTPDFKIGDNKFVELKGHADGDNDWSCNCSRCIRDKNKMELMKKQYPHIQMIFIGKKEYVILCRQYNHIDNWEWTSRDKLAEEIDELPSDIYI